ETDAAIELWERAVAADPRFPEAEKNLGIALYKTKGQAYPALSHMKAYLDLGGKDARVLQWFAEVREQTRTYRTDERASAILDRLEAGNLHTADGACFKLRDPALAERLRGARRGDRISIVFESATSAVVVDVSATK